jgi:hypothetical protein
MSHDNGMRATVIEPINGKFCRFRKGERVKASSCLGKFYLIERLRWKNPKVPIIKQCYNVPRRCLQFDPRTL